MAKKVTIALTKKAQEQFGEALEEMGYSLVDVNHVHDSEGDLMPEIAADEVDSVYLTWDFYPPFTPVPNTPKKVAHGRDVIVPRVRGWVHLPSAGLDSWTEIFEGVTLNISPAGSDEEEKGIRLTHSPGVYALAMGEYVVAHVLSMAKLIPAHIEQHKQRVWKSIPQQSLNTQTMGILGCGGIGLHTARLIRSFGITIIGTTRRCHSHMVSASAHDSAEDRHLFTDDELRFIDEWYPADEAGTLEVMRRSDYCVCCIPLTPSTREVIKAEHFAALGSNGIFINVARGDIVDQNALIDALNSDTIAGAVLDVTTPEPLPDEHPLWLTKNLIITPHDSPSAQSTFERAAEHFLGNARRFIAGDDLVALVSDVANAKSSNKIFW